MVIHPPVLPYQMYTLFLKFFIKLHKCVKVRIWNLEFPIFPPNKQICLSYASSDYMTSLNWRKLLSETVVCEILSGNSLIYFCISDMFSINVSLAFVTFLCIFLYELFVNELKYCNFRFVLWAKDAKSLKILKSYVNYKPKWKHKIA